MGNVMISPDKRKIAELLGYLCCANDVPYDVCKSVEGQTQELVDAFWDGWNIRFEEKRHA